MIEDNRKRVKQAKFSIQLLCFAFSKPKFFYCFLVCLQIFTTCFRSQDYMRETVNIQRFQHCFQTINYSLLSSQCSPCLLYEKQIQTIKGTYLFRSLYQIMRTYFCNIDLHHIFTTYKEQWQILGQKERRQQFLIELTEMQFTVPKLRDWNFLLEERKGRVRKVSPLPCRLLNFFSDYY